MSNATTNALETLEKGITELLESGKWADWLKVQARFHRYSSANTALIYAQNPDASRVAGFKTWLSLGRAVKKGEKAIWILAPRPYKKTATKVLADGTEQETETQHMTFSAVPVFDISQTDGDELPAISNILEGEDGGLFDRLKGFSESRAVPVLFDDITSANGYFSPADQKIVIATERPRLQQAKTLAHEIAHSILHNDIEEYKAHRAECELEAESVAFIVLSHFGLDSGDYSFGYVTCWNGEDAVQNLKASAKRIQKTAQTIIDSIEKEPAHA